MSPPKLAVFSAAELTAAARGDPWRLQDQLLMGDPFRINTMAEAFHRSGSHAGAADSAFDEARKQFEEAYIGADGHKVIDDSLIVQVAKAKVHCSSEKLRSIGTDLAEIAAALAEAQHKTIDPIDALNRFLQDLEADLLQMPWALREFAKGLGILGFEELENRAVAVVAEVYRYVQRSCVTPYEELLGARMKDLEATGYVPPVQLDDAVPDADPRVVHDWWTSLTPVERQAIMSEHPEAIGNLNGIPVRDRSAANERVMNADIRRVEDVGVPIDTIAKNPAGYGLTADDLTRYHNAINVRAGLDGYSRPSEFLPGGDPPAPYPTYLYVYEPLAFGGKGRAAISIGDPDIAPNTAVLVPGASQSVRASDGSEQGWFTAQREQAHNLYVESNRADPDRPTAVLAWMGYDSPDNGITAVAWPDPTAMRAGGDLLAHDVDGLWATHQGASHVTAVGYSAGAIVTADAAAGSGMRVNDMVLLGPVSTDQAHTVADLRLEGGNAYVGAASNDLNAHLAQARLPGPDPSGPEFGAERIKAETPESYSTRWAWPITDDSVSGHLHYFTAGSQSLYATADITSGNADLLADHDMLADGSETTKGVTDNHRH
ncbi:putative alpha/beta hydrolase [Nocardia brasiliensis]